MALSQAATVPLLLLLCFLLPYCASITIDPRVPAVFSDNVDIDQYPYRAWNESRVVPSYCTAYRRSSPDKEDYFHSEDVTWDIYISMSDLNVVTRQDQYKNICRDIAQEIGSSRASEAKVMVGQYGEFCRLVERTKPDTFSLKDMENMVNKNTKNSMSHVEHGPSLEISCTMADPPDEGICGICKDTMHGALWENILQVWCPKKHRLHRSCRNFELRKQRDNDMPRQCPYDHTEEDGDIWKLPGEYFDSYIGFTTVHLFGDKAQ